MNIEELDKIHSQLAELATKRANEIATTGKSYTLDGTERQFKASVNNEMTSAMFETSAPLQVGQIYTGKSGPLIILSVLDKPGCRLADVAEVRCTAQSFTKQVRHAVGGTVEQLSPASMRVPVLKQCPNEIETSRSFALMGGYILKTDSGLWEVTAARISGPKAHLSVRPYREPQAPQVKSHQKEMPDHWHRPQTDTWHSSNIR